MSREMHPTLRYESLYKVIYLVERHAKPGPKLALAVKRQGCRLITHAARYSAGHANHLFREEFFIIRASVVIANNIMISTRTVYFSLFYKRNTVVVKERHRRPPDSMEVTPFLWCADDSCHYLCAQLCTKLMEKFSPTSAQLIYLRSYG